MPVFAIIWPWIGLGAAAILLVLLVCGDGLQADRTISRWADMTWLTWLGLALTLLYQFEAHGLDLLGRPYALRGALCADLSYRDAITCPVPLGFITAANITGVWVVGLLAALLTLRWPLIGVSVFAIPLVNLFIHAGSAIGSARYMPGLGSALVLLAPLCLWVMVTVARRPGEGLLVLGLLAISSLVVLAIMLGSLWGFVRGFIGPLGLVIIQIPNAGIPLAVMSLGLMRRRPHASALPPSSPKPVRRRSPRPVATPRE